MATCWSAAKRVARRAWFREGAVRRCFLGPYAGLTFELSPQLYQTRMSVFYRAYEPDVTRFLAATVRPGMTVYDVGAHVGIHALYLGKLLHGRGRVYAFEAWPENLRCLERNVACNPALAGRIVPVPKAVAASDGRIGLTCGRTDGMHHLTGDREAPSIVVECTTLDHFRSATGDAPQLVVVDVEGAEGAVLRGAEELLATYRPQLLLEHHGEERRAELTEWLTARGYWARPVGARHIAAGAG